VPGLGTPARFAFVLVVFAAFAATAQAVVDPTGGGAPTVKPPWIFPVVGNVSYIDDFGAPRPGGPHQGIDVMAPKRSRAVAVEAGTVRLWTSSASAGCMLYLYGRSGTTYEYIHLNNDLTLGNDNRGRCVDGVAYANGIHTGTVVGAGRLLGYVGDSGDANGIHPHLHFEVHPKGGAAVDPYSRLRAGRHLLFATGPNIDSVSLVLSGRLRRIGNDATGPVLALTVKRVHLSTGWRALLTRPVTVAVPPGTVVERKRASGTIVTTTLASGKPGEWVGVRTPFVAPGLAAQLAEPCELEAERVRYDDTR